MPQSSFPAMCSLKCCTEKVSIVGYPCGIYLLKKKIGNLEILYFGRMLMKFSRFTKLGMSNLRQCKIGFIEYPVSWPADESFQQEGA